VGTDKVDSLEVKCFGCIIPVQSLRATIPRDGLRREQWAYIQIELRLIYLFIEYILFYCNKIKLFVGLIL